MKNIFLQGLFILLFLHLLTCPVLAETYVYNGGKTNDHIDAAWEEFLHTLPTELQEEAEALSPENSITKDHPFLSPSYWWNTLTTLCQTHLNTAVQSMTSILGMLLLVSILRQWQGNGTSTTFAFCSNVCMALTIGRSAETVFGWMESALTQLCQMMTGMLPVMTAISYSSGEVTTASVQRIAMTLFITVLNELERWLFLPLGQALFGISLLSAVCTEIPLGGFVGTVKKLFLTLFSFMLVIYSFIYGIQHTLARSADSLGLRTMRFAMGNFIPVVGGTLAEAFSAVREGLHYVRVTAGVSGIVLLLLLLLPFAISVWAYDLVLAWCQPIAELLGCTTSVRMLADTRAVLQLLSALTWLATTFFVFSIILFTKTAVRAG